MENELENVTSEVETPSQGIVKADDPYFYTKSGFTSEIFKLQLLNLPNYVGYTQLKKLLATKLKLKPNKIKLMGRTAPTVFVTFRCEEDREAALIALSDYQWKGRTLHAKKANPSADPLVKKRKEAAADDRVAKTPRKEDDLPVQIRLKNAVAPLWNVEYSDQLQQKHREMRDFLVKFAQMARKTNAETTQGREGLCCDLLPIRPSPLECAYRNKCEFNVGPHPETGKKTVGFRIGSYKDGTVGVAPPDQLPNLSPFMISAVQCFEEYVEHSERAIFDPETNSGHWKQLTVRIAAHNKLMLVVGMHPQDMTQEEVATERNSLLEYFGPGGVGAARCNPTSLYLQLMRFKVVNEETPAPELLWGEERIEETVLGMRFSISPNAFFQVNTPAAEVLYRSVAEMAQIDQETTVVDLCCGTGCIALSLARQSKKVIGIEMCKQGVLDARLNAQRNGVGNAEFVCGKAEDTLYDVLRRLVGSPPVVAVVDPPRAGLHSKVIKCIRGAESLRRLVFVSCSPQSAVTNFVDLCRPTSNSYKGKPFSPIRAVPVDLFPHTRHCELVLLFQR